MEQDLKIMLRERIGFILKLGEEEYKTGESEALYKRKFLSGWR